jgi:hypothetical protein
LTYIYFLCNRDENSNPYASILDKEERKSKIIQDIWATEDYDPSSYGYVDDGVRVYMDRNPKNEYDIQCDFVYQQIVRLRDVINQMDLSDKTPTGALVIKPSEVTKSLGELDKLVNSLMGMKDKANEKRMRDTKIRGNKKEHLFDNPDNITYLK